MIVILDTGILGLLCNPHGNPEAKECEKWLFKLLSKSVMVVTSDICDYEVRRGLVAASKQNKGGEGVKGLDELRKEGIVEFLPVDENVVRIASEIWAKAKLISQLNTNQYDVNFDIIICAHWSLLKQKYPGREVVVATLNKRDLGRFAQVYSWKEI